MYWLVLTRPRLSGRSPECFRKVSIPTSDPNTGMGMRREELSRRYCTLVCLESPIQEHLGLERRSRSRVKGNPYVWSALLNRQIKQNGTQSLIRALMQHSFIVGRGEMSWPGASATGRPISLSKVTAG